MKKVKGNLVEMGLNGDFDIIVHGCNCFHTMGAGIAKEIATAIPEAFAADCRGWATGDSNKLGNYTASNKIAGNLIVVNAYTQYDFKGKGNVNYVAIKRVFTRIAGDFPDSRIGIPKIGAGLAGGDWNAIELIIDMVTEYADITLVEFDG